MEGWTHRLEPHSLPDARAALVEDVSVRHVVTLFSCGNVRCLGRVIDPHYQLVGSVIPLLQGLCDVVVELVIPAGSQCLELVI